MLDQILVYIQFLSAFFPLQIHIGYYLSYCALLLRSQMEAFLSTQQQLENRNFLKTVNINIKSNKPPVKDSSLNAAEAASFCLS